MSLQDIRDLEKGKFRESSDGTIKVATTLEDGLLAGVKYDDVQATEPTSLTENYLYYLNATLVATVEVTYTTSAKTKFLRARRI
jgi:hypothetical protein